jgi:hypothetical protein
MSKIFVRERRHIGQGAGRPRYAIIAVEGADLKVYAPHIRKAELEKLAEELKAEIVYLPRGEKADKEEAAEEAGKGKRRRGNWGRQG